MGTAAMNVPPVGFCPCARRNTETDFFELIRKLHEKSLNEFSADYYLSESDLR
jgi:hypothetical protein